ncbi:hypothetical protein ACOSQ2_004444 [Xanthoceras sorbifolium]
MKNSNDSFREWGFASSTFSRCAGDQLKADIECFREIEPVIVDEGKNKESGADLK